jgi:hypothetical protein
MLLILVRGKDDSQTCGDAVGFQTGTIDQIARLKRIGLAVRIQNSNPVKVCR